MTPPRLMYAATSKPTATTQAMRLRLRLLPLAVVALALSACSTSSSRKNENSPYYAVPKGSVLQLHQPVEIRPGSTRLWIQRGRAVRAFDHYWPSCNFEVRRLDYENGQTIEPGRFRVRRTQFLTDEVVERTRPVRVASLRIAGGHDGGGHSMVYEGWHLWLESPDQPEVRRLTCRGAFADPHRADPPSIAEIREALGEIATLQLPKSTSPDDVVGQHPLLELTAGQAAVLQAHDFAPTPPASPLQQKAWAPPVDQGLFKP